VDRVEVVESLCDRDEHVERVTLAERVRVARLPHYVDTDDGEARVVVAPGSAASTTEEIQKARLIR
jgi:hypothetical protein